MFARHQIVKDAEGNHFLFIQPLGNGLALVESVATRERFNAPLQDLMPSDRVAF